jgi:hypothetical protein
MSNAQNWRDRGSGAPPTAEVVPETAPETVRLSINLSPAAADNIRSYSKRKGVSVTEAIRRAISVLAYIDAAQDRGASINVSENGTLKEVQFLA